MENTVYIYMAYNIYYMRVTKDKYMYTIKHYTCLKIKHIFFTKNYYTTLQNCIFNTDTMGRLIFLLICRQLG